MQIKRTHFFFISITAIVNFPALLVFSAVAIYLVFLFGLCYLDVLLVLVLLVFVVILSPYVPFKLTSTKELFD